MNNEIENLKKRLIYRSLYRGTKEMDKLIGSFVKEKINKFNTSQLQELEKFLSIDDDTLYRIYNDQIKSFKIDNISEEFIQMYKSHVYKNDGGETGIRTQERVAPLPVFKTGAFNHSAISP